MVSNGITTTPPPRPVSEPNRPAIRAAQNKMTLKTRMVMVTQIYREYQPLKADILFDLIIGRGDHRLSGFYVPDDLYPVMSLVACRDIHFHRLSIPHRYYIFPF